MRVLLDQSVQIRLSYFKHNRGIVPKPQRDRPVNGETSPVLPSERSDKDDDCFLAHACCEPFDC